MTAVDLLAPIRDRVDAYRDHGTPGLHAPQDRARLLAALDGALAVAVAYEFKAKSLDSKSDEFIPGEVRSRYRNMAEDEREHANAIRAAVVAALQEGDK